MAEKTTGDIAERTAERVVEKAERLQSDLDPVPMESMEPLLPPKPEARRSATPRVPVEVPEETVEPAEPTQDEDEAPAPRISVEAVPLPVPERPKRNFLARLFGRGSEEANADTEATSVSMQRGPDPVSTGSAESASAASGADANEPVERRVEVPVVLSAEEIAHGAGLRLILEVKITQEASKKSRAA
jgi:hypothetical protein